MSVQQQIQEVLKAKHSGVKVLMTEAGWERYIQFIKEIGLTQEDLAKAN